MTYYLQALSVSKEVILASIAPGLLAILPLAVNNLRDYSEDKASNKKTLVVRFGKTFGKAQYVLLIVCSILTTTALSIRANRPIALLSLSAFVLFIPLIKKVLNYTNPTELNQVLAKSSIAFGLYSLIFSICWVL